MIVINKKLFNVFFMIITFLTILFIFVIHFVFRKKKVPYQAKIAMIENNLHLFY